MVVPANNLGPTPQMYAKLAVAVLNKDLSVCNDDDIVAFIAAGSHADENAAHRICTSYIAQRMHDGWFEVGDPDTGESIRIEMPQ